MSSLQLDISKEKKKIIELLESNNYDAALKASQVWFDSVDFIHSVLTFIFNLNFDYTIKNLIELKGDQETIFRLGIKATSSIITLHDSKHIQAIYNVKYLLE